MSGMASNKILVAGLIGFVAGILYAPRKGTETQAKLKAHIEDMKSDMETKAKRAKSKVNDMKRGKEEAPLEKAGRRADETVDKLVP